MSVDDANSVGSGTSSIGDSLASIASETERRRAKLRRLRRRRRRSSSIANAGESSSNRSVNGIMTVRTLQESLNESTITKLSRKRRSARLQLEHSRRNISNELESRDDAVWYEPVVKFDRISIREYGLVAGDNPSVSTGPPVQLDWGNIDHYNGSVEEYEIIRNGQRRVQTQMRIPEAIRRQLLRLFGHSIEEIEDCTRKASIIRKQRYQSLAASEAFPQLEENIERLTRLFSTPFRRNKKRAEKELWDKVVVT